MKRGFAVRRDTSASRKPTGFCFTFADGKRFIAELCNYIPLLRMKSLRRRVGFILLSAYVKFQFILTKPNFDIHIISAVIL